LGLRSRNEPGRFKCTRKSLELRDIQMAHLSDISNNGCDSYMQSQESSKHRHRPSVIIESLKDRKTPQARYEREMGAAMNKRNVLKTRSLKNRRRITRYMENEVRQNNRFLEQNEEDVNSAQHKRDMNVDIITEQSFVLSLNDRRSQGIRSTIHEGMVHKVHSDTSSRRPISEPLPRIDLQVANRKINRDVKSSLTKNNGARQSSSEVLMVSGYGGIQGTQRGALKQNIANNFNSFNRNPNRQIVLSPNYEKEINVRSEMGSTDQQTCRDPNRKSEQLARSFTRSTCDFSGNAKSSQLSLGKSKVKGQIVKCLQSKSFDGKEIGESLVVNMDGTYGVQNFERTKNYFITPQILESDGADILQADGMGDDNLIRSKECKTLKK